ncbi:MAG: phosphonoacetaldehyde reductase [Candidatus Lokiarchaeota archaeon]|nr:phosphonoacetaldehyde reductase [Candidatus Lokiarchaeota archaeon]
MIEYLGYNSINKLSEILEKHSFHKIFLITGKGSFEKTSIKKVILEILKDYDFFQFNDFSPNPKINDIKKGLELFKKQKFDVILSVGGGSVIDMGKCISILSANYGSPEDFVLKKKKINNKGVPLIRIPTTAGSGSEATHFAVVYIDKSKYSLGDSDYMQPEYVIVDPQFSNNLPKNLTAISGLDAFTQAIESYWNINSTNESKNYARKAIELIMKNILKVVYNPSSESRNNMALAANLSGKAINITKTTTCHAISYPITSYFNVPHGHAVALTLPSMIVFNSNVNKEDVKDSRGVDYVKQIMKELISIIGVSNFTKAKEKVKNLIKNVGLETNLGKLGIKTQDDIEIVIKNGFNPERVKNNPRLLTETQLRSILEGLR